TSRATVFNGGAEPEFLCRSNPRFWSVAHVLGLRCRAESAETYVVAMGFRPLAAADAPPET
ncbi:MAG: 23S rRNA methyltransferase, partial [Alphaproteobacteria bacterium]|nr:23S rRNA methyltransferase [Alphaproteobacteria bacterium]